MYWHTWWLLSRTLAIVLVLSVLGYTLLTAVYFSRRPTISHNYWDEINADRIVPAEERAWPLYREAGLRLEPADATRIRDDYDHGPLDPDWPKLVELLERNQKSLDLARQAAKLPKLGYLFGDPEDLAAAKVAKKEWYSDDFSLASENQTLLVADASGLHLLQKLAKLLVLDTALAAEVGDAKRAELNLQSLITISEQTVQPRALTFEQLIALQIFNLALESTGRVLRDYPALFSDTQLRDLAHRLAAYRDGDLSFDAAGERISFDDQLQRVYSDNGSGGGLISADGFRFLDYLNDKAELPFERMLEPGAAVLIAGREDERQYFNATMSELIALRTGPPWTWDYEEIYNAEERLFPGGLRHILTYLYTPAVGAVIDTGERTIQQRDALLTAIALVLYHRRHDAWPKRLEQLVPGLLPEVPPDRFDGHPLRYVVRDNRPLLYSIGNDYHDDGGRSSEDVHTRIGPRPPRERLPAESEGAWILWPTKPRTADA